MKWAIKRLCMLNRNTIVLLAVAIMASGCVSNYATKSPDQIALAVEVEDAKDSEKTAYVGPPLVKLDGFGRRITDEWNYQLKSWVDREREVVDVQLDARIRYETGSWRYYNSANLEDGQQLSVSKSGSDISCMAGGGYAPCILEENVKISVPARVLRARSDSGLTVHINSEKGYRSSIKVPASYIQGYLIALEKHGVTNLLSIKPMSQPVDYSAQSEMNKSAETQATVAEMHRSKTNAEIADLPKVAAASEKRERLEIAEPASHQVEVLPTQEMKQDKTSITVRDNNSIQGKSEGEEWPLDGAWILRQPPNFRTVQIFAGTTQSSAKLYVERSGIASECAVFNFKRDGKELFAVIVGSYKTIAEAKQVVERMPEKVRKNGTWVRTFDGIHKLIKMDTESEH